MRGILRDAPRIPDHEMLRKIGGGSYGEVWMARSVTGALRAIKVVWREDFDTDRDFEREFEGIRNYEPISRSHPGLVQILHVGRSHEEVEEAFYFYVMELADDRETGQQFNPVEYVPHTFRSDMKGAQGTPLDVDLCIQVGIKLAEALAYLHERELAHRDVKPANIVYQAGDPKLADIGLVAMPGQRTFVGTEGFVPPEGPGTRRADVYSLGKVLYEMSTGMDRLDFPNLPDYSFYGSKAQRWKFLNEVICDLCDPRESHRKVNQASELVETLKSIQKGEPPAYPITKRKAMVLFSTFLAVFMVGVLLYGVTHLPEGLFERFRKKELYAPVKVISTPTGAEVWTKEGEFLGTTPLAGREGVVGAFLQYEFRLSGYSPTLAGAEVSQNGIVIEAHLPVFAPPKLGDPWLDTLGNRYVPTNEAHMSRHYMSTWQANRYFHLNKGLTVHYEYATLKAKHKYEVLLLNKATAEQFCQWLTVLSQKTGYLTNDYEIIPLIDRKVPLDKKSATAREAKLYPFKCRVQKVPFAQVLLEISPSEFSLVYLDGQLIDHSAHEGGITLDRITPGNHMIKIETEGYRTSDFKVYLEPRESKLIQVELKGDQSVIFEKKWENSLGMSLVPISAHLMACQYETTLENYKEYITTNPQLKGPKKTAFKQALDHPVVNVSRKDAEDFCDWLTEKERKSFLIGEQSRYRLPTDEEWSTFCGLNNEVGDSPLERDVQKDTSYYWGERWPPSSAVGNFSDMAVPGEGGRIIAGYVDGFSHTSPVGSFSKNQLELYDLEGNVYEWVSDGFGVEGYAVTRGGSWSCYQSESLQRKFRNAVKKKTKNNETGFRLVLTKER